MVENLTPGVNLSSHVCRAGKYHHADDQTPDGEAVDAECSVRGDPGLRANDHGRRTAAKVVGAAWNAGICEVEQLLARSGIGFVTSSIPLIGLSASMHPPP